MPTLSPTELAELEALKPTSLGTFTTQHAIDYYTYLANKGFDYGTLALGVVQNNTARGKTANAYAQAVANDYELDFSVGSANWKTMQYNLILNDWTARNNNGGAELSWSTYDSIHADAFDQVGLPAHTFTTHTPLNKVNEAVSGLGQLAWDDFVTQDGFLDNYFEDGMFLVNAGLLVSPNQSWADFQRDYADMVRWYGNMAEAFLIIGDAQVEQLLPPNNFGAFWSDYAEFEMFSEQQFGTDDLTLAEWLKNTFSGEPTNPIAIFGEEITALFAGAFGITSPLVFDLDDSGTIELISLANSETYWDIDADGFAEVSGWVTGGDGLLALDVNEDGIINDNTELFGNSTGYANGFAALASYDLNHDNVINSSDSVFTDLIMWIDANENGYSEDTELYTLADLDIISINMAATEVSQTNQGHSVTHTSTFTVDTGSGLDNRAVHDVWFQHDNVNTQYAGDFSIDVRAAFLPTLRGYGNLPSLHIAMPLDNEGTGNLLGLVSDLGALELDDIFTDDSAAIDDVRDILFRWAGVDGVSPTSRGPNIDARELEFLEKMMGQPYRQHGFYEDPYYFAAQPLKEAFNIALDNFAARLIAQSAGEALFEGDWFYNISTDEFEGITGLNLTTLGDLETLAGTQTSKDVFWQNVVRVIDGAVGVENLSGGDETALDDAIYDSDNSLSLSIILDSLEWDDGTVNVWTGQTSGDDSYTGGSGMDEISGAAGNDTLNGGAGADSIFGQGNNDTLDGQAGDDYIQGGTGNDTYKYTAGQGWDTFDETGGDGTDRVLFASGIAPGDLTLTRVSNNDLLIEIASGAGGGRVLISGQFNTTSRIETLEFAGGGSTITLGTQDWTLTGTAGNDILYGVEQGGDQEDTIYGGAGDDTIYAYAPNYTDSDANWLYGEAGTDTIYGGSGADTLSGGDGNDSLTGGNGNDIYIYNTGHDVFHEGVGGTDEIQLAAGIVAEDITYSRIGSDDLLLTIDGEGSIRIDSFYQSSSYKIETLRFSDNSTVNLAGLFFGSASGDTMFGTSGNDIFYGLGGNDSMYGYDANDTFYGGLGDDYMEDTYGGNDVYVYESGLDSVYDYLGTDILRLTNSATTINDISISDIGNHHKITINGGVDEITLYWFDYSSSYNVETIEFADGFSTSLNTWTTWTNGTGSGETLNGGSGNDTLVGKAGTDTLNGNNGNDAMHGGADNDTLNGGSGTDLLHGGAGNDTLNGNDGLDTLYGGDGLDTFMFDTNAFNNIDVIKDFDIAEDDALDIADILVGYNPLTDAITDFVTFTNNSGNSQVFVDRDGTGSTYSAQQVALLYGVVDLDAEDLLGNGNLIAA
jgi:Ca2+-binding RTX toxin-like protein